MFEIECEKALPSKCRTRYRGIAYDGCRLYLTVYGENKVVPLDCDFRPGECFDTYRCYTVFCYDPEEKCFWAAAEKCPTTLYRLNECFEETECIPIHCPGDWNGPVTGLSWDCCHQMLVVSFASGILRLNPKQPKECVLFKKSPCERMMGVLGLCPYTICRCAGDHTQKICIYSDRGRLLEETKVPWELTIEAGVFFPCEKDRCQCKCRFLVLASKPGGYSYLLDCILNTQEICEDICQCNYQICRKDCGDLPPGPPPPCEKSCCQVLESIALVEASIAHILNAEGEKLQKAIASTDNIKELLEVNESVRRVVEKATRLEYALYDKLDALHRWCCGGKKEGCDDDWDWDWDDCPKDCDSGGPGDCPGSCPNECPTDCPK